MVYPVEAINSNVNFIVKNLNSAGATQPSAANAAIFSSEATLDAAIGSTHAAKDKPHLTLNDKVFAARFGIAAISPFDNPSEEEEE